MYQNCLKRVIDFALSVLGIVVLSPVLILLSILIKCTSKGPVFFRQKRVGKDEPGRAAAAVQYLFRRHGHRRSSPRLVESI